MDDPYIDKTVLVHAGLYMYINAKKTTVYTHVNGDRPSAILDGFGGI